MDPQGRELKLRMQGADVLQLQTALRTLGATITDRDGFFGQATRQAVTNFQSAHGLPGTGIVDVAVRQQINAALESNPAPVPVPVPVPDESDRFSIEGEVVQPDGTALRGYRVTAFDRALCQWRSVGTDQTNAAGRYHITYTAKQLEAWGKTRADLKVEVHDPSGDVKLAESALILQALPREIVNFAVGEDLYRGPDEYTRVDTALEPHVGSLNDLTCLKLPDILILAREARLPNSHVAYYVKARRWAADLDVPAALFYGLMRRNQPPRLDALLARSPSRLWAALQEARAQNIIKLPLDAALRGRLSALQQRYLAQPEHPHTRLLNTTTLSPAQQAVFTERLITTDLSGDAFWQSLASDDAFAPEDVGDLRETFALQAFTDDNTSLAIHLRSAMNVRASRQVAAISVEAWRDTILTAAGVEIPEEVLPDGPEPARRQAYAQMLYRGAEFRYPTPSLAGQMTRSPAWAEQPVSAFFAAYQDFEFDDERITFFLQEHPEATALFPDAKTGKAELLRMEQLFHLTPPEDKLSVIQPLWDAGLRSAPQIAFLGRQHLMRLPGGLERKVTTGIYRQAVHLTSVALHLYLRYTPRLNSLSPHAVRPPVLPVQSGAGAATMRLSQRPRPQAARSVATLPISDMPREQALAGAATTLPEWEALFGSTDACECSHCESALSPAAYLVSAMAFLQRAIAVDGAAGNALDELLDRRPDLGTLQLTCANTETELPQIDLVCEILENIAASADHKTLSGAIAPTTWDREHLAAQPEHFNPAAYELLRLATYPFNRLPFDLWLEEGRRYLGKMGITRDELMRVMPPRTGVGAVALAAETLGMSTLETDVVRLPNTRLNDLAAHWGVDLADGTLRTQLGHVETLIRHAAIDYDGLLRLLNTRYVNPDRLVVVTFAGDPCALDGAELTRADGSELTGEEFRSFLDRLHRFLRLQRRLGWSEYDVDLTLPALGAEDFNANGLLPDVAAMQSMRETFSLSPGELCSWWGDLSTHVYEEDVPSQYEAIFLDPSLFPDTHTGSGPDLRNGVFALTNDRTDLAITTSTNATLSRWLAESDAATPPAYTLQPDYSAYIQSVTRLTADDLLLLVDEALPKDATTGNVALNLANVSLLFRIASFVRAIKSSVPDYQVLRRITGISPLRTSTAAARPLDSESFHTCFREIEEGEWSVDQLAYVLLGDADAATVLAPTSEDMDAWLTATSPGFAGMRRPGNVSAELKAALTQSLGSTAGVDSVVLDALLFVHRPALGDNLLAHLIVDANPGAANLPTPSRDFHAVFETVYKFGIAWKGLGLDSSHLGFVLDQGPTVGWTDIAAFPVAERTATNFDAWRRLTAAADLQVSVFTVEQSLFGLLQAAIDGVSDPAAFVRDDFLAQISAWSGWSLADVVYLTGPDGFNHTLPDTMQDERPLVALRQAFESFRRSGVSAEQAHAWTGEELTFTETQSIKQALTRCYEPAQWLDVLAAIQDELRPLRRDALLDYLLHTLGFDDSTDFFHHYLIDPGQAACARTSRIVEAHAALQIFAQRILFNLEPFEFSPQDAAAWQWRKNYRVWEAAQKVFLYPQNWLEPEWRDDKSAFFQELEDGLSQDDITPQSAERLYREYLSKVDRVSRLEIMGMYEDTWVNGDVDTKVLHVVGRTRDIPHSYYYRRWEDQAHWTPWEPVPLDIQSEHLTPIVYNGRLYLFWPTFTLTPIEPDTASLDEEIAELDKTIQEYNDTIAVYEDQILGVLEPIVLQTLVWGLELTKTLKTTARSQKQAKVDEKDAIIKDTPANDVEVGMAWSTYAEGRWSPKRLATTSSNSVPTNFRPNDFYLTGWIAGNRLYVAVRGERVVETEVEPVDVDVMEFDGLVLAPDAVSPPPTTVERLDVGYFYFDDCQAGLVFVADADLSAGILSSAGLPGARTASPGVASAFGGSFEMSIPVVAPAGEVQVADSIQSFDSRKLTGAELSFEIGADVGPEARILLANAGGANARVRYAHQYGRGGRELSPFFYTDDTSTYFVEPLPDAPLLSTYFHGAAERSAAPVARIANSTPGTPPVSTTHYQQSSTNLVIDRGSPGFSSVEFDHLAGLDVILAGDPAPAAVAGTPALTGFRYRFTRFYHPYTCSFLRQLSRYGVDGLLDPDPESGPESEDLYRQLTPLETFDFEGSYGPNSQWVSENSHAEEVDERIDFDHDSPYGVYNWEAFFHIPLLVATRLMQNQRFDDARRWLHYIFNPAHTDGEVPSRFWKTKPFYQAQLNGPTETLQELVTLLEQGNASYERQVEAWERDPFQPHTIARLRITAYMQATVRKYLDCLIRQGDKLFTTDMRESVVEAEQLYLLAGEILGERPTVLPAQEAPVSTPNSLLARYRIMLGPGLSFDPLDVLTSLLLTSRTGVASTRSSFRMVSDPGIAGTAVVESLIDVPTTTITTSAPGGADTFNTLFLFCIPQDDLLHDYWDTVDDRLFKIRHCMNLSGQVRQLALFAPPIDPALLIRAAAAGLDLQSIISGLYESLPSYRFSFMLQKALELCGEVRTFGGALLAALEKQDGEKLSELRSTHEIALLGSIRVQKQKAVEEADSSLAGLLKSKDSAEFRAAYYSSLEKVSSDEQKSLDRQEDSRHRQRDAEIAETTASILHTIPTLAFGFNGPIPAQETAFGGPHLGAAAQAFANTFRARAAFFAHEANKAGTMAGYDRRLKEWRFQADLAKKEIALLDKQILAADIRKQIAEADLASSDKQIAQAREVEEFLKIKFTNQQLFSWMVSKLSSVYFQIYQMAYQAARQAEKAYQHELGPEQATDTFIQLTNWDSLKKGLLSGELLQLDLRRMEKAHLDANRRELEITKPVSLFQLEPAALLELRQTGGCDIHIPEVLFDLDFADHYFRRIKAVRLTIPGVAGPYTNVSATLTLTQSWTRREIPDDITVAPERDITVLPQTAIATCTGSGDSGMFELVFNDPRYLPFEGAGAISTWRLELPSALRPFDYRTIADVVMHISYTARAATDGGAFRDKVNANLVTALNDWKKLASNGRTTTPARLLSLRHEFPNEWYRLTSSADGQPQQTTLSLGKQHFPRYLDYLWNGSNGEPEVQPISLRFGGTPIGVILDPADPTPAEADPPRIAVSGLSEISNDAGADVVISVRDGVLESERWRDLYLLLPYEVVA